MIYNSQENNPNSLKIKISYNNENYEFLIMRNINASQLRKNIFSKYNINNSYILSYRNIKIKENDSTPILTLFKNDPNPLLFINDNNTILPSLKQSSSITINSNMPQQNLLNILNFFFQSKHLPLNASIKTPMMGIYSIKFNKPYLAQEFLDYYSKRLYKNNNYNNNKVLTLRKNKNNNKKSYLPKISGNKKEIPIVKDQNIKKISSANNILIDNNKTIQLYNVIKEVYKSDKISQKSISSGINKYHPLYFNTIAEERKKKTKLLKKNEYINTRYVHEDTYEGMYSFPFMSQEEKYMREKFLDKKNWLNKKGFLVSIGKYKMKDNFIPNYVNASPSESPLIHKYREVNKKKWINGKGFIV